MDPETIKQHTQIEVEALDQVTNALQAAIAWRVKPKQLRRKISSVRFVAQSFQRYLERTFALEENDGFMQLVMDARPSWDNKIDELKRQHQEMRATISRIVTQLDHLAPDDRATFENHCHELLELVKRLDKHNRKECDIMDDALCVDIGGEG